MAPSENNHIFESLVYKCRSIRRFDESFHFTIEDMRRFISITRYVGSAGNMQIVRYMLSCEEHHNNTIFNCLRWATYLKDWDGPVIGERPSGYIVVLIPAESHRHASFDAALAVQTILLSAVERGLGGCILGSIDRKRLRERVHISDVYRIEVIVALGKPVENIEVEETISNNIRYWRDTAGTHHVPKLPVEKLILPLEDC